MNATYRFVSACAAIAVLAFAVGCPKSEEKKAEESAETTLTSMAEEAVDLAKDEAVLAVLVKADAYDGKEDKVISKCPNCALGMDGSDKHAVTAAGYSMHFCSADCKAAYEKDTRAMILALKVPEAK